MLEQACEDIDFKKLYNPENIVLKRKQKFFEAISKIPGQLVIDSK